MQNECGVVAGHAYSVIEAFEVTEVNADTGFDDVVGEVYMVRNPWGSTLKSDGEFSAATCTDDATYVDSYGDSCSWYDTDNNADVCGYYDQNYDSSTMCCACGGGNAATPFWAESDYASQIPHGVDYTTAADDGIFFLSKDEFLECFDDFQIGHYRAAEGYVDTWYDRENDSTGSMDVYTVTPTAQSGDLYFTVETYYLGMVPSLCQLFWDTPFAMWSLYKNNVHVKSHWYDEYWTIPVIVSEADYAAGDVFTVEVDYDFTGWYVDDYTVKVYSSQSDLEIIDEEGETNMLHMDGCSPSGLWGDYSRSDC